MKVIINKANPKGKVNVISSKSYSHRYLLASMLSNNESHISNVFFSNDIMATLNCMSSFGCVYKIDNNSVSVINNSFQDKVPVFDCNESGSTLRFLIPIALTRYEKVIFKGSKTLISRGIQVYEKIFENQDIKVVKDETSITINGKLKPGVFEVDGSLSSQFITGLLFALPLLDKDSIINIIPPINSLNYIYMTLDVLNKYGIKYSFTNNQITIYGNQKYVGNDFIVEGDYSNASFLKAFNYFGGNIILEGLNENSLQGDKVFEKYFEVLNKEFSTIDISNCIDLGPILMAFAAIKNGGRFIGTSRLKIKESDRANAMKEELAKVNVKVDVLEDEIIVHKCKLNSPIESFDSHNDHRIAMAMSIFSSYYDISINNAQAINKSYPNYFKELEGLGVEVSYETI